MIKLLRAFKLTIIGAIIVAIGEVSHCARAQPVGFGQATTGGCTDPSCICYVTTLAEDGPGSLKACAENTVSQTILFQTRGLIELVRRGIVVGPDKTIDGRPLAPGDGPVSITSATDAALRIGASNVIVRNLYFPASALSADHCLHPVMPVDAERCGSGVNIRDGARNVWIDGNEFANCTNKCITVWAYAVGAGADAVTISHNYFHDAFFGILIGAAPTIPRDQVPPQHVTLYANYFQNVFRRSPRAASFAQVHAFNNVVENWDHTATACDGGFGPSSIGEAQLLLEGNVLTAGALCKAAVDIEVYDADRGMGLVRAINNVVQNGATVSESLADQVFVPPYPYTVLTVGPQIIAGAGVTR